MDARIKILCAAMFIIATAFMGLHSLAGLLIVLAAAANVKKVGIRKLGYPLFVALVVAVVQMYDAGALAGLRIFLRIFDSVLVLNILIACTSVPEVVESLRGLLPSAVLHIAKLMFRYVSIFEEEASIIYKAQWARGGYMGSAAKKARSYGTLCGMLLLRSLDRAITAHRAMLSRGYNED